VKRKLTLREKILSGLLVASALLVYRYWGSEGINFGARLDTAPDERALGAPPRVRMDLLEQGATGFDPRGRNLFDYYTPPPPPRAMVYAPPPPPVHVVATPPPPPPTYAPRETVVPPPLPAFQYLGYIGPKDAKIAIFDAGKGTILKRTGEVVQEEFRLLEFRHDGVTLGYTNAKWKSQTTELKQQAARGAS